MGWFLHEAGDAFEHLPADAVPKGAPLDPAVIGLGCRRFRREQDDAIVRLHRQKVFGNLDGLDQPIVGADEMIGWKQDDDRVWIAVKNVREGQEHAQGGPAACGLKQERAVGPLGKTFQQVREMVLGPDDQDLFRSQKSIGSENGFLDQRVPAGERAELFGPVRSITLTHIGLQSFPFSSG